MTTSHFNLFITRLELKYGEFMTLDFKRPQMPNTITLVFWDEDTKHLTRVTLGHELKQLKATVKQYESNPYRQ